MKEVNFKDIEREMKLARERLLKAEAIRDFCGFAEENFKSGKLGNNFGKNQVGDLIFKIALDFSAVQAAETNYPTNE